MDVVGFERLTLLLLLQGNGINPASKEGAEKTHLHVVPLASVNRCSYSNKACGKLAISEDFGNTGMRSWCKNLSMTAATYDQQGGIKKKNISVPAVLLLTGTFAVKTHLKI